MLVTREQLEAFEDSILAPYGFRSRDTRGREFPDKEPKYRTVFQRDRDRILHTTTFRRLEYKTQVFVITEGDYYRTRLTHTLEVAQIGRTIARALGANEDLIEAICLAHDLGHPPFGHAGESALNLLMKNHGGFEHNRQSFRIVTELECRFPDRPGLNLTWEVREGIVKHETEYDEADASDFDPDKRGHIEAQIANVADELAYTAHDLDDGLHSGLITPEQLKGLQLWEMLIEAVGWSEKDLDELTRHRIIRKIIGLEVSDILEATAEELSGHTVESVEDLQALPVNVVVHSDAFTEMNSELKSFLYENMYRHHRVYRMQVKAERILEDIFNAYTATPEILPAEVQKLAEIKDFHRVVTDYIAGMTDRFAIAEHGRIFNPLIQP